MSSAGRRRPCGCKEPWTGYLGGAVTIHVRLEHPIFSHVLFPIYVAAFLWGGLLLREPRLRALAWRS